MNADDAVSAAGSESPVALRGLNWTMAALLGATAAWILIDELVSK